jgi:hypothetical protein
VTEPPTTITASASRTTTGSKTTTGRMTSAGSARRTSWAVYAAFVLTGFLLGTGLVMGIYQHIYGSAFGAQAAISAETTVLPELPSTTTAAAPRPASVAPDLISEAKRIKPLADMQTEDRVIYQGTACYWLKWSGDVNTSVIRCPGRPLLRTQTMRLTPVEAKLAN